jgi:hypothetical protein
MAPPPPPPSPSNVITKLGLFDWNVMSFGMKNVTIIFSQMTTKVFGTYMDKFLEVFVDDLNGHSLTWEKHIKHLQYVLMRFRDVNLKLNPNTCEFAKTNLTFMSHVENGDGT